MFTTLNSKLALTTSKVPGIGSALKFMFTRDIERRLGLLVET